jgi:signal transduction histidine kinase
VRWGLRPRLIIAFVAVALLGAAVTTVYSNLSLTARLEESARARLANSAKHFGEAAAVLTEDGRWTQQSIETMHHLAQIDFLAVQVRDAAGEPVFEHPPLAPPEPGAAASAPIRIGTRRIGSVTVSRDDGHLFTEEELALRGELARTNILAGVASLAVALAAALYLAVTLSRPLRRIRAGAEAMGAGDLEARVPESGDAEIRAVAEALNGLAETLQQEEELRKENVADLAHELRTPVMGLLARIEAAQDGVLADEAANLAAMHDEALRLTRLLDDLSSLAEAQRPGLLLDLEAVDLAGVARAQAAAFAPRFAEKGIAFAQELEPALVEGEPKRLEQVLANLLSNALRYTDPGGSVMVRLARADGRAVLDVRDTGIGIAEADVAHVFTRFWRGEKSRSRATGGAGIGLSIVRELVRAHGGEVTVQSAPGEGSVFRVTLPLAVPAAPRAGRPA